MTDRTKYLSAVKFLVDDNQKLRQENEKLRSDIKQLIEVYEMKRKAVIILMPDRDELTQERLNTKKSEYRTIVSELNRLLKP